MITFGEIESNLTLTIIRREASALLVLLSWAMREPLRIEQAPVQTLTLFLFFSADEERTEAMFSKMKRVSFLLFMMLACTIFTGEAIAAKKVAVYVEGAIDKTNRSIINSAVIARLSGNKDYVAFERNTAFVNALDKENDYQVSGDVTEREIRSIGERLGVDYVIVVNCEITDDKLCHMSARLIDLVSGEIIKSTSIQREYTGSKVLGNMANNVAYRLINKKSN